MNDLRDYLKHDLKLMYLSSFAVSIIMTIVSIAGIILWDDIYPASQAVWSVGSDAFNLAAMLPILLVSMWLANRGRLIGMLLWPGALFYVLYIYVSYVIGLPVTVLFLPYVLLAVLSLYTIIGLIASIDRTAVRQCLAGIIPRRAAGGVLIGLALLFIVMDTYAVIATLLVHAPVDLQKQTTWAVDFIVECPALLLGGAMLWQGKAVGYMASTGLLLQIGLLLVAVPVSAVLGALLTGSSIDMSSAMLLIFAVIPLAFLAYVIRCAISDRNEQSIKKTA